jgi:hypothetical protein
VAQIGQKENCICSCCESNREWQQAPLDRHQAALVLGISVRCLYDLRSLYGNKFEISTHHRGRVLFYREHINKLREVLKWENTKSQSYPAGIRSGKTAPDVTTFTSKGKGSGVRRASAVRNRLKKR